MTTVSVITPTIGRPSLLEMLKALVPQLAPGDEVLVVGDGPQPAAREMVEGLASPYVIYWETEPLHVWGNPQRNRAIERATGDRLAFIDDDDMPLPDCIATIKKASDENPGRPLMFKMLHLGALLWRERKVELGNVSGQMFIAPNVKGRLGRWTDQYAADLDFIQSTLALYPEGWGAIAWRDERTTIQGYVGPHRNKNSAEKKT